MTASTGIPPTAGLPDQRQNRGDFGKPTALGTLVGVLSVALCVALLLLIVFPEPPARVGGGGLGGGGTGSGYGSGKGDGIGQNGDGLASADGEGDSYGGAGEPGETPGTSGDDPATGSPAESPGEELIAEANEPVPTRRPVTESTEMSINPLRPASQQPRRGSGGDTGDGEEGGGGSEAVKEFLGVKVKGSIALVCDVSGSMSADFPILYRELRRSFPRSTPLIMVPGCHFGPPSPSAPAPQKGAAGYLTAPGIERDPHVYLASNTTDAIIYAVEKLRRRTVMFNNDLQDGGSMEAIEALNSLRRKRRFTLSGRSLNCNAPECLLKFIRRSGGDFKVDTISRAAAPARPWGP